MSRTHACLLGLLFSCIFTCNQANAQYRYFSTIDSVRLTQTFVELPQKQLLDIAKLFLETPYQADMLNKDSNENLVITVAHTDCQLFVETILSLYKLQQSYPNQLNADNYAKILGTIRYRNGNTNNYISRLHYFSDWIYENQRQGLIKDLSAQLGGIPYNNSVNFMSQHPQSYDALAIPENRQAIQKIEQTINKRKYHYIPKTKLNQALPNIKDGDIIAITTNIPGLDITHVGFACYIGEELHFLHASSKEQKVIITKSSLNDYLANNKHQTGVMILRFKN